MTKPPSGSSSYPPIPGSLGCRGGMTPDLDLLEKRRKKRRGGTRRPGRWIDLERGHRRAPRAAEDGQLAAIVGEPPSASGRATGWCRAIRSKFSTWRFWSVLTTAISAIRSALRTRNADWSCAIDSCRSSCATRAAQTSTNTAIATRLPYSSHCCWRYTRPGSNGLRLAACGLRLVVAVACAISAFSLVGIRVVEIAWAPARHHAQSGSLGTARRLPV